MIAADSERDRLGEQPRHVASGRGRGRQHARALPQLLGDPCPLVFEVEGRRLGVPLVQDHQRRTAAVHRQVGDPQILRRHAVAGVADHHRDVSALRGALRAQRRVVLDRLADLRLPAHAGGVDDHEAAAVDEQRQIDCIASGARLVGDDHALLTDEAIDERGLADIRPPDHREANGVLRPWRALGDGGQQRHQAVE